MVEHACNIALQYGQDRPTIRLACTPGVRQCARAHGLARERVVIQSCIVAGGGLVGHDTARDSAAGLYREIGTTQR